MPKTEIVAFSLVLTREEQQATARRCQAFAGYLHDLRHQLEQWDAFPEVIEQVIGDLAEPWEGWEVDLNEYERELGLPRSRFDWSGACTHREEP